MNIPTIHPPALKLGDTIGIVAPAGPIEQRDAFETGIATLRRLGFRIQFDDRIFHSKGYLAGDDAARAEELMDYFENPEIKAVLPIRGGYGCARLLPLLEEKRLRQHCKLFMGFSDLTTLHLLFRRRFGWITIHGPMAASIPSSSRAGEQENHLVSILTSTSYRPKFSFPELASWSPGVAEGKLVGGCLSLLVASLGTTYEVKTDGAILFLEDHGEPPYRLDRMLTQLYLAGKLQTVAGILLGSFDNCGSAEGNCSSDGVLREILCRLEVPIISRFPAGHGQENWALPFGVRVRLNADDSTVQYLEAAVV